MEGWIKLHRALLDWQWFNKSEMVHIFMYCLLKANHNGNYWQEVEVQRGSFITSIEHISKDTGISFQTVRTCLKKLENTGEINKQTTNKFTIITICNYDSYQQDQQTTKSKLTNKQQTTNKQLTTNKNDNNDNNIITWKNDFETYKNECLENWRKLYNDPEFIAEQSHLNPQVNIKLTLEKAVKNFWGTEAGWKHKIKSKTKTIDWKATAINAISVNKVYFTKEELKEA